LTHFDQHLKKKRGMFRYDRQLSEKPEIRELVNSSWKSADTASVISKLNNVRRKLIEWSKLQAASSKEIISKNQILLEKALSDPQPVPGRVEELQSILVQAYADEEAFWRQRSRIQWLTGGDK